MSEVVAQESHSLPAGACRRITEEALSDVDVAGAKAVEADVKVEQGFAERVDGRVDLFYINTKEFIVLAYQMIKRFCQPVTHEADIGVAGGLQTTGTAEGDPEAVVL